ncbi:MAG: hypothetical protein D6794_10655, partial [Deltaproteobacteria bacterium]
MDLLQIGVACCGHVLCGRGAVTFKQKRAQNKGVVADIGKGEPAIAHHPLPAFSDIEGGDAQRVDAYGGSS